MKKLRKIMLSLIAVFALCGIASCMNTTSKAILTINKTSITLEVGEEVNVLATKENTKDDIVWTSEDTSVATVDNGCVTGVSVGETQIKVTCGSLEKTCQVTVTTPSVVGTLTVDYETVSLNEGSKLTVSASVLYKEANVAALNYSFTEDSNEKVVKLTQKDNSCEILAVGYGTATITVHTTHLGVELTKTISVEVKRDISLEATNLELTEQGYSCNLVSYIPQGMEQNYKKEITPMFKVVASGAEVTGAQVSLTDKTNNGVIEIANNKITALKKGEASVEAKYVDVSGEETSIIINVKVESVKVTKNETFDLDKTANRLVLPASCFEGEIAQASLKDTSLTVSKENGEVVLSGFDSLEVGNQTLTVETSVATYVYQVCVVTKVLNTKEDLDQLGTLSSIGNAVWDGYFVLGQDIDYQGVFTTFCGFNEGGTWGGETGFVGTFDGRGHKINGFQTAGAFGGLFGTIGNNGVVKNVIFTNAEVKDSADRSGIVASFVYGTIENVYVEVKQNGAWWCGGVCEYAYSSAVLKNIVVVVTETNGRDTNFALTSFSYDEAQILDCYSVGALGLYRNGGDSPVVASDGATHKNFASLLEMKNASLDLSTFTNAMWDTTNQLPLYVGYFNQVRNDKETVAITNDISQEVQGKLELTGSKDYTYSLKEAVAGITLDGTTVTVVGNYNKTFTVVATHILDASITVERTFKVCDREVVQLTNKEDVVLSNPTTELTIDQIGTDTISKITINGVEVTFTQENQKITLSNYASVACGEQDVVLEGAKANYQGKFVMITKVISSTSDWLEAVALKQNNILMGYYVLASDLDYLDTAIPEINAGLGWGAVYGFTGTFDGRGHQIKNVTLGGDNLAFFGTLGIAGVIKNVAFTNATISWGGHTGVVCNLVYGTIENVFVEFSSNGGWWTGGIASHVAAEASISHCVVKCTSATNSDSRSILAACVQDSTKVTQCVGVGILDFAHEGLDAPGAIVVGANNNTFANEEAYNSATLNLDSWDTSVWNISSGRPVFITK
jgi:hypothetical protein